MARILLIDDDQFMAATTEKMLQRHGHEVVRAPNGAAGVALFGAVNPDVVITDIVMPEQNGIETIGQLLALSAALQIIAISGGGRTGCDGFLGAARKAGAVEALAKPFRMEALIAAVARCMARAERSDAA